MAKASGKLAHYLRCGLPVICMPTVGLNEVIAQYRCGLIVRDLGDVRQAIETILEDYESYSKNAVRCYEDVYEFGGHFQEVLDEINSLRPDRGVDGIH
jgi:glycosyltransferase involved in cell wall biosynthesis